MLSLFYCAGDVFVVIAPIDNDENVKYYLMHCTQWKMKLLENYNDHGFWYERGSIILKGYFFRQTNQSGDFFYFDDYEHDVISCQCSHLVCAARIKLIEVQSKKKSKIKRWKMSKSDHERIIEDGIPLEFFWVKCPTIYYLWIKYVLELPVLN